LHIIVESVVSRIRFAVIAWGFVNLLERLSPRSACRLAVGGDPVPIHNTRLLASMCLLAALSMYGCDDDDNGRKRDRIDRIGPSPISFRGFSQPLTNSTDLFSRGVTLQRDIITPQLIAGTGCPTSRPFLAPFTIVGTANGELDIFLREVQMRFVDRFGIPGGSRTLAQAQLAGLFGSTRLPSQGSRLFPLSFPLGCLDQPAGTLALVVVTGDLLGRRELRTFLSVSVQ
jgi:hypothetical protein